MRKTVNNVRKAFRTYDTSMMSGNKGFIIAFANRWEVSVVWGFDASLSDDGRTSAEVAIFDPELNWYTLDGQRDKLVKAVQTDVMSHVTPEVLANIMQTVSEQ